MNNSDISAVFDQIADILEFQGANPFRVRAYRNAAKTIHDLPEAIADVAGASDRKLTDIEGIGADLAKKIDELLSTGRLQFLEELKAEVPETVFALMRVQGLGPKRAATLFRELNVATLDELRHACEEGLVSKLKGFGEKTQKTILEGIDVAAEADQRILWAEADLHVQAVLKYMRESGAVDRIEAAGSYRRCKDSVGDLDFLAVAKDSNAAMDRFIGVSSKATVLGWGDTKMSLRLPTGLQVDFRVVKEESFGAALQYFTGSKEHNVVLRSRAKNLGLKINEYGVFRGEEYVAGKTEEEVYAAVGLPWITPELREARREFEWADAGALPQLVEIGDICGDLHMHTTWTDGMASAEEMALAAKERGLKFIAITDHSQRVAMVGGLTPGRVRAQWKEIDELNASGRVAGVQVLKGIEVDILEKGGLDLPDDVLAEADWVVASLHYGHNQPKEQITRRAIEALENPYVCAIAHPTGRMLLRRKAYEMDVEAVLKAARDNGKMMELNSHPIRLDLDDSACAMAKALGVPIVINTDAHRTDGLDALRFGVMQARRGGLTKEDVGNARSWAEMKKMLGR